MTLKIKEMLQRIDAQIEEIKNNPSDKLVDNYLLCIYEDVKKDLQKQLAYYIERDNYKEYCKFYGLNEKDARNLINFENLSNAAEGK